MQCWQYSHNATRLLHHGGGGAMEELKNWTQVGGMVNWGGEKLNLGEVKEVK